MGEDKIVCPCKKVSKGDVLKAVQKGATSYKEVQKLTGAGSKCGHCEERIRKLIKKALKEQSKGLKADKKQPAAPKAERSAAEEAAIQLRYVTLDCREPEALARFYCDLLGWQRLDSSGGDWVDIAAPDRSARLGFQHNPVHERPVWPEREGQPQQQLHLDFAVKDREAMTLAIARALSLGATEAAEQFSDNWHVMIDPAGHPFCFVID